WRIEADSVADAAVAVRIVRQYEADAPFIPRRAAQACPAQSQVGDKFCTIRSGLHLDHMQLCQRIAANILLEADGARENAAIEFRQGDVHGDVMWREACGRAFPRFAGLSAENNLQPRCIRTEGSCALAFTGGKRGGIK